MAGIRQYKELFIVEATHEYYANGFNKDFLIEPTEHCLNILKNYGFLVQKSEQSRLGIYFQTAGTSRAQLQVIKPIDKPIKLSFNLYLRNANLLNFSYFNGVPLTSLLTGKSIFYFTNINPQSGQFASGATSEVILATDPTGMVSQQDKIKLLPAIFNIPTRLGDRFVRIMRPQVNNTFEAIHIIELSNNEQDVVIDWRNRPAGWYQIQWLSNLNPVKIERTEPIYIDATLLAKTPFGLIDLYVDNSFLSNANTKFLLRFTNRKAQWVYIVIDKYGLITSPSRSTIQYTFENPYPANVIFDQLDDVAISNYLTNEQRFAFLPSSVYLFKANIDLPSYEVPLKNLKLNLINGNSLLLPSLSQQALKPEIFIHL
jgi:hypothetical protein